MSDSHTFSDYADRLLRKAVPGSVDLTWGVGIGAGEVIRHDFDYETPHLVIHGRSGSGKTELAFSCLCQLCHNNTPDDLNVWIVEPKNQLQAFKGVDHIKMFADQLSAGGFLPAALKTLQSAVEEMNRRYKLFAAHPDLPQDIALARKIAADDPGESGHLALPHILVVLEEFSWFYPKPSVEGEKMRGLAKWRANRSHAKEQRFEEQVQEAIRELARKARPAGIHLMLMSQYARDKAVRLVQQASTNIGLAASDAAISMVYVGTTGLEHVTEPGQGRIGQMGAPGNQRDFRGFLLGDDGLWQMIEELPAGSGEQRAAA